MLVFSEYFYSLQGEGRYSGTPSLFLRFARCNMSCSGFGSVYTAEDGTKVVGCDSLYAVDKENFSSSWKSVDATYLISILDEHLENHTHLKDLVITGGEPLLHSKDEDFLSLLKYARSKKMRITMETNATINVDFRVNPIYRDVVFALSVKLANSGELKESRIKSDVIKNITSNAIESFYKFTVDGISINSGVHEEIEEILNIANIEVYCMALSQNSSQLNTESQNVADFCLKHGYTYSDRLHLRLYDGKRGS